MENFEVMVARSYERDSPSLHAAHPKKEKSNHKEISMNKKIGKLRTCMDVAELQACRDTTHRKVGVELYSLYPCASLSPFSAIAPAPTSIPFFFFLVTHHCLVRRILHFLATHDCSLLCLVDGSCSSTTVSAIAPVPTSAKRERAFQQTLLMSKRLTRIGYTIFSSILLIHK